MSRLRKLVFGLVITAGLLGAIELLLWTAGLPTWRHLARQDTTFAPADRTIASGLRRHYQEPGRGRPVTGETYWLYEPVRLPALTVNEAGFRGPLPGPKRPGELRVALVGGSSVYGWLVGDEATVPALVAARLAAADPARPVTVLNWGVEGYRFQQELDLAEDWVPRFRPDVVVFLHGANDALTTALHGFELDPPWTEGAPTPPLVAQYEHPGALGLARRALKRSRLVTAVLWLATRRRAAAAEGGSPAIEGRLAGLVAGHRELLERAAGLEELGVRVGVFLQPTVFSKEPLTVEERVRLQRALAAAPGLGTMLAGYRERIPHATPAGVELVDLADVFDGVEETVFQDWVHPSPRGNELIARRIARWIERGEPPGRANEPAPGRNML